MSHDEVLTEVTQMLHAWEDGKDDALSHLLPLIYDELRARAHAIYKQEKGRHVLQATALVNEVYLRLIRGEKIHFENRAHFYALTCRMMRRILVEQARKRLTLKRGGDALVSLNENCDGELIPNELEPETLLTLDKVINRLAETSPRAARVLELKVFSDLEIAEISEVMSISTATVKREWAHARQRLFLLMTRR